MEEVDLLKALSDFELSLDDEQKVSLEKFLNVLSKHFENEWQKENRKKKWNKYISMWYIYI